jgi:hypothetical protein
MTRAETLDAMTRDELRAECTRLDAALALEEAKVAALQDRERLPAPVPTQFAPKPRG